MYVVYILKDIANKSYVGTTEDVEKRLAYHDQKRGALFTKHGTSRVVFKERYASISEARKREIQIKKWWRDKKDTLIARYQASLSIKGS